jgi:hypothetical protein
LAQTAAMLRLLGSGHKGSEATSEIKVIRLRIQSNELRHQMSVAPQHSAGRDADETRPVRSIRSISVPLFGEMRQIPLSVLLPVVFAANVVIATVAWYIVGILMR